MHRRFLVTGGAGFIGSALVRHLMAAEAPAELLVIDKLTYASTRTSLESVEKRPGFHFLRADVADEQAMQDAVKALAPECIIHLAAETHVDRSLETPGAFIRTNVMGTYAMLVAAHTYWSALPRDQGRKFRFIHVSTDEVFGALGQTGQFNEASAYQPNSPYSASKAGSDHLVRAWWHSYGLPTIITNCSNNYGPFQFPEKLIPRMILAGLAGETMPIYGNGQNVRDWLHVEDHVTALTLVAKAGQPGETYCIGGDCERPNLDIVGQIARHLDVLRPDPAGTHARLMRFVEDRPGHDWRYAIDARKLRETLGWRPSRDFETGLAETVRWYLDHPAWVEMARAQAALFGASERRAADINDQFAR
ncbi:RfbB dTDP-D-glucose 4,6-dehydratase [Rhabdaerophilaceae bacterium]